MKNNNFGKMESEENKEMISNGYSKRTDLAIEAQEIYNETAQGLSDIPGVKSESRNEGNITVTRVRVEGIDGEKALGKPPGMYVTIEAPGIRQHDPNEYDTVTRILAKELSGMHTIGEKGTVLVVGLGNWNITPDSLGPKTVSELLVTRHLTEYMPEQLDKRIKSVCAIAPGVLGLTGIETSEIIKGVVDKIKPDLVIAIDSLASAKMERVSTTIQIADTGIIPGSGVGNKRSGLNQETLGTKVIGIGVPTVVDAATIVLDTIDKLLSNLEGSEGETSPIYNALKKIPQEQKYNLIRQVLQPYDTNVMVTPKEVDVIIDDLSGIIADGINLFAHNGMTLEEIQGYMG